MRFFLYGEITQELVGEVTQAMYTYLDETTAEEGSYPTSIRLYINSHGGCADSGWALIDTMKAIKDEFDTVVDVYVRGAAASIAAIIVQGATGTRYMGANSSLMLHKAKYESYDGLDIESALESLDILNTKMYHLLAQSTGREYHYWLDELSGQCKDLWYDPDMAIEQRLIHAIG